MATDIRGLYQNNRRREVSAVVGALPFVLDDADLREGIAEVDIATGDYTVLTIPADMIITGVQMVVKEDNVFDGAGTTMSLDIGGATVVALTPVDVPVFKDGVGLPLITTSATDVIFAAVVAGSGTQGKVQAIITYIDYDRATMSYIGEE